VKPFEFPSPASQGNGTEGWMDGREGIGRGREGKQAKQGRGVAERSPLLPVPRRRQISEKAEKEAGSALKRGVSGKK